MINKLIVSVALATVLATGSAQAATIYPVSAVASSQYPGYEAQYAIDPGVIISDWAAFSTGAGSYLNLDLGAVFTLATASVTDRTTSCCSNFNPGLGSYDFTRSFSLQATDSFFNPIGAPIIVSGLVPPPTGLATIVALGGLTTEFLRYTILVADGPNPGLADIYFDGYFEGANATPLPSTWLMLLSGFAGLGFFAYRGTKKRSAALAAA